MHTRRPSRAIVLCALLFYAIAIVTPAFRLAGDLTFGWAAAFLSFAALGVRGELERGQYPAVVFGAIANSMFVVSCLACLVRRPRFVFVTATVAVSAAAMSIYFLFAGIERFIPLPGVILWILAPLLLCIASMPRAPRSLTAPQCPNCGYDLTGHSSQARCPECGDKVWRLPPASDE